MTDVDLDAVLDEQKMTLGEVMNFEVGQTLMLNVDQDADIDLRCSGVSMLKGKTGTLGRHKAVRGERIIKMDERAT